MSTSKYVEDHLEDFFEYIRIPSISAQNKGIKEASDWLIEQFNALDAEVATKWDDQGANPIVFASFKGNSDKTILFYNHYDVQPPEPMDEWKTDPFEPIIKDGKIYARGICDDKGELMSRLTVIKYYKEHGGLPVNVKFFVEGSEEIGSPKVEEYVNAHRDELSSDVCIWEGGGKDEDESFQITCGLKGISSFDLSVKTADRDIHSSLAVYAPNAIWRLVSALQSMKDDDDNIIIDGFNDDVKPLSKAAQKAINEMDFNTQEAISNAGIKAPLVTNDPKKALINGTTLTINGISGGYEGDGIKTIVPKEATAKLDCRLVPDQDPEKIFELVKKHLSAHGFDDIEAKYNIGEKPFRTDLNDPFVQLSTNAAHKIYGDQVSVVPNTPGGGPAYPFYQLLNDPILMVGIHYSGSGPHAPNENIRVKDYYQGTEFMIQLLEDYQKFDSK